MNDKAIDKSVQRPSFADILGRIRDLEVWIVGDIMLDEYVVGTVDRVSPEAPVPVVRVCNVEYRLGGAANVARQVAALGARASVAGVLGKDTQGGQILTLCEEASLDTRAVLQLADRHSTRKVRVLGQNIKCCGLTGRTPYLVLQQQLTASSNG